MGYVLGHVTSLSFEKLLTLYRKKYNIATQLQWQTNMKSYVTYQNGVNGNDLVWF